MVKCVARYCTFVLMEKIYLKEQNESRDILDFIHVVV